MFDVKGLVLAAEIPTVAAIGTPSPAAAMVKGTVACDSLGTPAPFDTPPVPLSPQGDADFQGITTTPLPSVCNDAVFLTRIVGGIAADRWIAHGAVRTP